jgi:predicted unusual protein kinase regulating ubiquinone biosynthesis (AarF/ABC1/UbiB family)
VQRPDAIEYAALDMFILRKGAAFLKKRFKLRSDLVGIVDVFGAQLFKELDYVQEAHNCNKFKDMYGGIPNIYVPSAYLNLTNRRVLTMEFVEGVKGPWNEGGERMLTLGKSGYWLCM